jgi:hypothetical protein
MVLSPSKKLGPTRRHGLSAEAPGGYKCEAMPSPGEILKSNVDSVEVETPRRAGSRVPVAIVLGALVLVVIGIAIGLLWGTTQLRAQQTASAAAMATAISRPTAPAAGGATRTTPSGPLPDVNGISCDALESTIVHIHVHLAIFIDGTEQQIPFGVGIGQPWQVSDSSQGPFVNNGSCFYWIHTHTGDGVLHVESPVRRRFTLGDFFAIWQVPLSATQVGSAQGQVITYVNGQRDSTNPSDIPLLPHERVQLDVGTDVPPYQFDFPPGD